MPKLESTVRRRAGTHAVVVGVCLTAIALMWIAVAAQARFERREAIAAANDRNVTLAIDIPALIADRTIDVGAFTAISIVDERGRLVATSFERVPEGPLTAVDRPHFTVHVARDTGKVFVGQPIRSRLTGRATIPISRRINKPDGSFGGIVSVQMDGPATIRALRAIRPDVRIIAASGLPWPDAGTALVPDFLPKPYSADALLTLLHRVLAGQPSPP